MIGASSLTKVGSGTLFVGDELGTSTYGGGTTVANGTLVALTSSGLPTAGGISVAPGATLAVATSGTAAVSFGLGTVAGGNGLRAPQIDTLLDAATFIGGGNFAINTAAGNFTYGSAITNAGLNLIVQAGSNTLTLSGQSTYSGSTTVASGTLLLGVAGHCPAARP